MWLVLIIIIFIIILVSNLVVFPLGAGSIASGEKAIMSLKAQLQTCNLRNYNLVAAIVEPREKDLVKIVRHYINVLPIDTHFQIYHGTKNLELLYENFSNEIVQGKISLWDMNVDNLTIQGYSALLTSREFWSTMQSENVLIFQTDTITCSKSQFILKDFMDYDFVGAPVSRYINFLINLVFACRCIYTGHNHYYNGGLSFRKKSTMLAVIDKYPWDEKTSEDVWFCAFIPKVGGKLPDKNISRAFSFESEKLECIPWGLHKPRKEFDKLCKVCPEFKEIPFIPSHSDYRNLFLL